MKKLIALLLCCVLCLSLFACTKEPAETEAPTDHIHEENDDHEAGTQPSEDLSGEEEEPTESQPAADDHSDHAHINYKGLTSGATTLADVEAAEGKAPDFSFESNGVTYYAYKDVSFNHFEFSQVQISFSEDYVRISCTYTAEEGLDEIYAQWNETMIHDFGEPSQISENENVTKWTDHTGNHVTLSQLNETTVQLCYYLVA